MGTAPQPGGLALRLAGLCGLLLLTAAASPPPAWTVTRDSSRIEMAVRAFGGSHTGRFEDWRADVLFDPEAPGRTRATVVVQSRSLKMSPSAASSRATGPAFLDSARYPDIRLDLQALRPLGGERYSAEAAVTIRGQTRTITFPVDLRVSGDRAHLTGAFALDRADFGIGTSGPWNGLVGRQVTVRVALQAQRG
jgi:polyisoprenoid-binding protein YceI